MSDSTVESTHMSKTPITTKSSVGAKKKGSYNEFTGPWRGMHDICKKGKGEETVRAEKKRGSAS